MYVFAFYDSIVKYRLASAFIPPERRWDHRRLPCLPLSRTPWRCMDVRARAFKAGISANRRGGRQSALKSVDYAPQVLSGRRRRCVSPSNRGASVGHSALRKSRDKRAATRRELIHHHANRMVSSQGDCRLQPYILTRHESHPRIA